MTEILDFTIIDTIIKNTTAAIESGKEDLFGFSETAKDVHSRMLTELERVDNEAKEIINNVDRLEEDYNKARFHLMEVSRDFAIYTEDDMKQVYDMALNLQVRLAVEREREHGLRLQRDELKRSSLKVAEMVNKAEELVSKIDIALTFLTSNLTGIGQQMESIQQKQLLGGQIIQAQEEERKRVAREIHDGPAQTMANVVLRAEFCEKLLQSNREMVVAELRDLKQAVKGSLQEIRRIIFNLRPMTLDDLGLVPTIRRYLVELQERENFTVRLEVRGEERRLINTYEVALFRLIQESLNNARKYAEAKSVSVLIEMIANLIVVKIVDNGKGFDLAKILNDVAGKASFGLLSMKERIELLNGKLTIDTAIGSGTKITAELPIEPVTAR